MDTPNDEHQPVAGDAATEPPSTASLVTAAIVCSLLLSMARVFILANVFGYSAPDPESGGWTLFTTFVLLSIATVSLILSARRDEATAISRSMAWAVGSCVLFGFVYGLFTRGIFSGVFCGLCIGCGAGYVAGINGVAPSRLASDEMKKLLGIACGGFVGFGLLGFLTPIPLVPKAVYLENRKAGEAASAQEAATANPKGKLTAFKAVVAKFKQFPDRFTPDSQRRAFNEESEKLVQDFIEYPFDAKANPSIARSIVELYEDKIEGNYSGHQYNLIDECIRNIYSASLDR